MTWDMWWQMKMMDFQVTLITWAVLAVILVCILVYDKLND